MILTNEHWRFGILVLKNAIDYLQEKSPDDTYTARKHLREQMMIIEGNIKGDTHGLSDFSKIKGAG